MAKARVTVIAAVAGIVVLAVWGAVRRASLSERDGAPAIVGGREETAQREAAELASIFAEKSNVVRLHRLVQWVEAHTVGEGRTVLKTLHGQKWDDFHELLLAKLADDSAGRTREECEKILMPPMSSQPSNLFAGRMDKNREEQLAELAARDPEGALRSALTETMTSADRAQVVRRIFRASALADPQRALRLLAASKDINKTEARQMIAESWTEKDPEAALAWARTLPASETNDEIVGRALESWGRKDAESAVEAAISAGDVSENPKVVDNLLRTWLKASPESSLAWLRAQPTLDKVLRAAAVGAFAESHPKEIAQLLTVPMPESERRAGVLALAEVWSSHDSASAYAWLNGLPKGELYFETARVIAGKMASVNPGAALALYESLPPLSNRDGVANAIAEAMPNRTAALNWLVSQHDSIQIRQGLGSLLYSMGIKQPADMVAWLPNVPTGEMRDRSLGAMMSVIGYENPQETFRLADSASSPEVRVKLIGETFLWWYYGNSKEALATLPGLNLTPGEKEALLLRCKRGY